ncbi:MAG TPA: HAD family phosphatase [Vicinamibacterales bacterium]
MGEVISAVVFDFDGVIVDSEPLHLRAYQELLEPLGHSLPREEYYARYLGYDDEGMFRELARAREWAIGDREIETLIEEKTRILDTFLLKGDHLYPGAAECVARLASMYPLGIASGALRHEIEAMLRGRDLLRLFRFIVASGDTAAGKPAPDPYRRAAELHELPPDRCVAVEDSRWGIESAKAAGLWCIGITNTYPVAELLQADAIITSLDELTPELIATIA